MSPLAISRPLPELIPEQEILYGFVSTVMGPVDHRVWQKQLERIDDLMKQSGADKLFQRLSLAQRDEQEERAAKAEDRKFRALTPTEQLMRFQTLAPELPAFVFASAALHGGPYADGRDFPEVLDLPVGVCFFAMVLPAGPGWRNSDSGQERVAALQQLVAGRANAGSD